MKAITQLLAVVAVYCVLPAHAQDFPGNHVLYCVAGKQSANVELGSEFFDGKGGALRKAGMVGLHWGSHKAVWAKPEKLADGSYKVSFPGRKPMTIKEFRKLTDSMDTDPYLSIEEQGGQKFMCSQAMG